MSTKLIKGLRITAKVVLIVCGISLVGFLGYSGYLSIKAKPRNVVVTNITDSSATVSWVTDIPTSGVVYYDQGDSFLPGILASFGKNKAYDDRDVSDTQTECVNEFNADNEDFTVEGSSYNCTEVTVSKKSKYYTHHVTLLDLDPETEYSFRFSDGFWSWKDDLHNNVVTFNTPDSVDTPRPMFGRVVTEEGYSINEDGVVYFAFNTITSENDSILVSSTTNVDGSWYLDTSAIRDFEGNILELVDVQDVFKISAQFMNGGESGWIEFVYNGNIDGAYPDITVYAPDTSETELQSNALMRLVWPGYAACDFYAGGICVAGDDAYKEGGAYYEKKEVVEDEFVHTPADLDSGISTYHGDGETGSGYTSLKNEGKEVETQQTVDDPGTNNNNKRNLSSESDITPCVGNDSYNCASWMDKPEAQAKLLKAYKKWYNTGDISAINALKEDYGAGNVNNWFALQTNKGVIDENVLDDLGYVEDYEKAGIMGAMSGVGVGEKAVRNAEFGFTFSASEGFNAFKNVNEASQARCDTTTESMMKVGDSWECVSLDAISGVDYTEYDPSIAAQNQAGAEVSCSNTCRYGLMRDSDSCACVPICEAIDQWTGQYCKTEASSEYECENKGGEYLEVNGKYQCIIKPNVPVTNVTVTILENGNCQLSDGSTVQAGVGFCPPAGTFDEGTVMQSQSVGGGEVLSTELPAEYITFSLSQGCSESYEGYSCVTNQDGTNTVYADLSLSDDIGVSFEDGNSLKVYFDSLSKEEKEAWLDNDGIIFFNNMSLLDIDDFSCQTNNQGAQVCTYTATDTDYSYATGEFADTEVEYTITLDNIIVSSEKVGLLDIDDDVLARNSGLKEALITPAYHEATNTYDSSMITLGDDIEIEIPDGSTVFPSCWDPNRGCAAGTAKNLIDFIEENSGLDCGYMQVEEKKNKKYVQCYDPNSINVNSGSSGTDTSGFNIKGLTSKVHAQSEEESYFIYLPEAGAYGFQLDSGAYQTQIVDGEEVFLIYRERNGVEGIQIPEDPSNPSIFEDELVPLSAYQLKYKKFANVETIDIKEGINIISLPFLPVDADGYSYKAFDLFESLRSAGVNIRYMAQFEGGKWDDGFRCEGYNECTGENFDILPGQGYLILAENSGEVSLPSYELLSPIPVELSPGWNLIGINGYTQAFTAKTFLQSVNQINGLTADNMTWWPTSKGKYEGIQLVDGQTYGLDYAIDPENGYFVRISEFAPSNENCKSLIWQYGGELNGTCGNTESIF